MNIPQRSFRKSSAAQQGVLTNIDEFIALRHDIHAQPELAHKEFRTSELVASHLRSWGYEITTGIAGTGVVGTLKRGKGKRSLAIRADMDALPIEEDTGLPYASINHGIMHAAGMMDTQPSCLRRRASWPRMVISAARSILSFSQRKK